MPFTGIVEEIGTVLDVHTAADLKLWDGSVGKGMVLKIGCAKVTQGAYIGCSIAVNGVCLTVTSFEPNAFFTANCAPETLRLTNLGDLLPGSSVNLERAMAATDRNSGHTVQGHVDGVGTVVGKRPDGEALWVTIGVPTELAKYIVKKGYIAVDGTSLTVTEVDRTATPPRFSVMLVAHTQQCVTLPSKEAGSSVNIEVDVVSKYVEANLASLASRVQVDTGGTALAASEGATGKADGEMREITAQLDNANQHGAGLSVPLPSKATASKLRIGIVRTAWHADLIDTLESKCVDALLEGGVQSQNILRTRVSGSFELPYVCQRMIESYNVDCVVAIGILLKGGTIHMEVIAHAMTKALLDVQLKTSTPVIFGVLTVFSMDQAKERAESDLGTSWGQAALAQAAWRQGTETTSLMLEPLPASSL
eukprot:m.164708 g.164708  ORF g.164708 m.164708 type:complete len:422 (-) comp12460_c0_seq1:179-1444(-)